MSATMNAPKWGDDSTRHVIDDAPNATSSGSSTGVRIASSALSIGLDLESLRVEGLERQAGILIQENAALKLGLDAVRSLAEMPGLKQALQSSGA